MADTVAIGIVIIIFVSGAISWLIQGGSDA